MLFLLQSKTGEKCKSRYELHRKMPKCHNNHYRPETDRLLFRIGLECPLVKKMFLSTKRSMIRTICTISDTKHTTNPIFQPWCWHQTIMWHCDMSPVAGILAWFKSDYEGLAKRAPPSNRSFIKMIFAITGCSYRPSYIFTLYKGSKQVKI